MHCQQAAYLLPDASWPIIQVGSTNQGQEQLNPLPCDAGTPCCLDCLHSLGHLGLWRGGHRHRLHSCSAHTAAPAV
jgi:hypothetical protein